MSVSSLHCREAGVHRVAIGSAHPFGCVSRLSQAGMHGEKS